MYLHQKSIQKQTPNHKIHYQETYYNCDIKKVTNCIYIGDELVANNKKLLTDLNIKRIVVVGLELKVFHPQSFQYLVVPVRDHRKQQICTYFQKTNKFIDHAHESNQIVLVHCAKGISRSATIILAFLMYKYKMNSMEATMYLRRKRKQISPNEGFLHQLKKYGKQLGLKEEN